MAKSLGLLEGMVAGDRLRLHRKRCQACRNKDLVAGVAAFKKALLKQPDKWAGVSLAMLHRWCGGSVSYHAFRSHLLLVEPGLCRQIMGGA